ncbi:MAG: GAF domain-containing protein [Dehalococcoidia bacterium]
MLYFVALQAYDAAKFVIEARRTSGLTCRRMQCVAFGAVSLGLLVLWAGLVAAAPPSAISPAVSSALALASGVAYFFGFTPPKLLRLAWQAPELRAFLSRVASLPRLPDADAVVQELERGAASVVGAPRALLARLDPATNMLVSRLDGEVYEHPADAMPGGWAFTTQRPMLTVNAPRDARRTPTSTDASTSAPSSRRRSRPAPPVGALVVYAPREPVFAEDDLALVQLVADQAAVVLEARRLIEEAARVQAREEATASRTISSRRRRMTSRRRSPPSRRRPSSWSAAPCATGGASADIEGIRRIVRESRRLNRLVVDLLRRRASSTVTSSAGASR